LEKLVLRRWLSKLSGDSVTEQEAKLKGYEEQIKEMEKIIGQQKV
jgi:predicted nucleotide-binding protein (sugar kinase/HSP70/actin superfamily)